MIRITLALGLVVWLGGGRARGQGPYLFVLDLAGTPLDEFPSAVRALNGTMTVVDKNGRHMLRASSPSDFLITLPQALPADFTVEVELIPKACCNPEDLMLEGTPARNRGVASVELTWQPAHIMAVGGGGAMYQSDMPADLAASTPGNLTQLVWEFKGTTVKFYTNGRRLYTLDKQFVRGRVLRVFLGGQDEGAHAVYLAGLRIGTGPAAPGVIAASGGQPSAHPAPPGGPTPLPGAPGPGSGTGGGVTNPPPPATPPPPSPGGHPPPPPPQQPVSTAGAASRTGPVTTTSTATRTAARCAPGTPSSAAPLNFQVGGGRVGGAVLAWWTEAGAEYLVERSPDAGGGRRSWTRLTSTCDIPDGMTRYGVLWEDGNTYPVINLADVYPGIVIGSPYVYRVTVIHADGTSGSSEGFYTPVGALFMASPIAAVNGSTVRVAADISYCAMTPPMRCDPWMMELTVTSSSSGFRYSSVQPFTNSYDPNLPITAPGGMEGTFVFVLNGVPPGTHTFALTAVYQPDHRADAGSVTVTVP